MKLNVKFEPKFGFENQLSLKPGFSFQNDTFFMACKLAHICLLLAVLKSFVCVLSFTFSYYKGELYVNVQPQSWDRGYQTAWGLLQLDLFMKRKNLSMRSFISHIDNIRNDNHDDRDLAFWRPVGDDSITLWPE
jgi:hypothetical protein